MVWDPNAILFTELHWMDLGVKLSMGRLDRASRKNPGGLLCEEFPSFSKANELELLMIWLTGGGWMDMLRFKQGVVMMDMDWLMTELEMCCSG